MQINRTTSWVPGYHSVARKPTPNNYTKPSQNIASLSRGLPSRSYVNAARCFQSPTIATIATIAESISWIPAWYWDGHTCLYLRFILPIEPAVRSCGTIVGTNTTSPHEPHELVEPRLDVNDTVTHTATRIIRLMYWARWWTNFLCLELIGTVKGMGAVGVGVQRSIDKSSPIYSGGGWSGKRLFLQKKSQLFDWEGTLFW